MTNKRKAPDHDLLSAYKGKLVSLARSHAALLAAVASGDIGGEGLHSASQLSDGSSAAPGDYDLGDDVEGDIKGWLERVDGGDVAGSDRRLPNVRVGVGALVTIRGRDGVAAGIRKRSHGSGTLALPGGHLEFGESWAECAARELEEETGLSLPPSNFTLAHVTNDPMPDEGKHYVTIFMKAEAPEGSQLINLEPEKCKGWGIYSWGDLESAGDEGKLFGPLERLVKEAKDGAVMEWICRKT